MNNIFDLIKVAEQRELYPDLRKFAKANGLEFEESKADEIHDRFTDAQEFMYGTLTGKTLSGEVASVPSISIEEALSTGDVSVVMNRVFSQVLREPTEPNLFLSNVIADRIPMPAKSPKLVTFPTVSAMEAGPVSEEGEYPEYRPVWGENTFQTAIQKFGIMTTLTDEVIAESVWPLVNLFLRMMSAAVDRYQENLLYQALTGRALNVFNNESADTAYRTTGERISGAARSANGSLAYDDIIKMAGVILGRRYNATHLLIHPLAWPIILQDPVLRNQFVNGGQIGGNIWGSMPKFDQSANFPLGMQYVPYYAINPRFNTTLTSTLSSLGASLVVDCYMLDKANSLMLLERGEKEMDQMDVWMRDAKAMKVRKFAAIVTKDQGRGMVSALNIRAVKNEMPAYSVLQATS